MKSILFFNNKGGVGKTTLACNVVSYLNMEMGKRVLLVDADPQCNSTQAMLDDGTCEDIYINGNGAYQTLYSALQPFEFGEPEANTEISPFPGSSNRFNTDLLPGHPKMSIIEDKLSDAWSDIKGRGIGGFRTTNWCSHLITAYKGDYDLVVFDVGPSLGALNRSIILGCDYLVTPFGCDIFSLLGIQNIASWIQAWEKQYTGSIKDLKEESPNLFDNFSVVEDTSKKFRFAGFSVQQYVTKKFKDGRRPVKSYDKIMSEIPATIANSMGFLFPETDSDINFELGHIPYLYSLVPMSQAAKAPIHSLKYADGVVGSQYAQVESYKELMASICTKLLNNIGLSK